MQLSPAELFPKLLYGFRLSEISHSPNFPHFVLFSVMSAVQHNMNALNAYNKLNANVAGLKKASEKLSSGYRINRAGDDAAGLAISEKMRSQIRGLNQAVRNSQDGINMIQTFEGAAQETHSILQRMKELASESANGTYDNATDRAAIQLEFDQLNDELNQIADTDFNGTVVLNGGQMADGLKQVNGEFDYANKADQVVAARADEFKAAQAAAQANIDAAKTAVDDAQAAYDALGAKDLSDNGDADMWNTVDNKDYDKAAADALWKALGLTSTGDDTGDVDYSIDSVELTITLSDDGKTWEITGGYDSKGNALDEAKLTAAVTALNTRTYAQAGATDTSGLGGVQWTLKDNTVVNSIFDATNAKAGDTVTLKFTNLPNENKAPDNIGLAEDSFTVTDGDIASGSLDVKLSADLTDKKMDTQGAELSAALDKLAGAKIQAIYEEDDAVGDLTGFKITIDGTDYDIDLEETDVQEIVDGLVAKVEGGKITIGISNGKTGKDLDMKTGILEITPGGDGTAKDADGVATNGTIEGTLAVDFYNYNDAATKPDVTAGKDRNLNNASLVQDALDNLNAAKAALADAQEAMPQSVDDLPDKGVTKADAFDNSTARMTYTDHIVLQTGSRTKDAVDFTFKYNVDDTADMGELKANLNISSREDGLNTANLSLANQDDANYAIDQIDKAINKVSMVRATFGSIQNRLEHKITNLTTTSENLQEAESSIRDTDMASEMMNYTKFNILQQAAQSMLAQANQQPQSILQLLG